MDVIAKYLNRSFVISSLLPASLFILVMALMFPIAPIEILSTSIEDIKTINVAQLIFPIAVLFWIAFLLQSGIERTISFFSGKNLPSILRKLFSLPKLRQIRKVNIDIEKYLIFKEKFTDRGANPKSERALEEKFYEVLWNLVETDYRVPNDVKSIEATELGNILATAEYYLQEQYNVINKVIWPRLFRVLPEEFTQKMETAFENLSFNLNSSLLSLFSGVIFFVSGASLFISTLPFRSFSFESFWRAFIVENSFLPFSASTYFIATVAALVSSILTYSLSLYPAVSYSNFIRSAYDLYRFELLRQLKAPLPKSSDDEKNLWFELCVQFAARGKLGSTFLQDFDFRESNDIENFSAGFHVNLDPADSRQSVETRVEPTISIDSIHFDFGEMLEKTIEFNQIERSSEVDKVRQTISNFSETVEKMSVAIESSNKIYNAINKVVTGTKEIKDPLKRKQPKRNRNI